MSIEDPSFADLYGGPNDRPAGPMSGLTAWLGRVYDLPLSRFSVGDLACACRQGRFPERIVPLALKELSNDPLAGELYEGELIRVLSYLPPRFWEDSPHWRVEVIEIFEKWTYVLFDASRQQHPQLYCTLMDFVRMMKTFEPERIP